MNEELLRELTIPTRGFLISSSVIPRALNRDLWGACCIPVFTASLFMLYPLSLIWFYLMRHPHRLPDTPRNQIPHGRGSHLGASLRHDIPCPVPVREHGLHGCLNGVRFLIQVKGIS